jgi:hypothetical protein
MFKTPEDRLSEVQLYEMVAEEIANNQQSKGLWAKAIAETEGEIEKAKALYIKLRVQMIMDEWAYADKVQAEEAERRRHADEAAVAAEMTRREGEESHRRQTQAQKNWDQPQYQKDYIPLGIILGTLAVLGIFILLATIAE